MYINSNIKHLRTINKLTQKQLGSKIGIERHNIEAYELNRANPPLDKIEAIADYFEVSIDDLIRKDLSKPTAA